MLQVPAFTVSTAALLDLHFHKPSILIRSGASHSKLGYRKTDWDEVVASWRVGVLRGHTSCYGAPGLHTHATIERHHVGLQLHRRGLLSQRCCAATILHYVLTPTPTPSSIQPSSCSLPTLDCTMHPPKTELSHQSHIMLFGSSHLMKKILDSSIGQNVRFPPSSGDISC